MLAALLLSTGLAALIAGAVKGRQWGDGMTDLLMGTGNLAIAAGNFLIHNWIWVGLNGACALWCLIDWWRDRRKRKRALRALGAKSRALLAALARKAREVAQPRPVLRPAPHPG